MPSSVDRSEPVKPADPPPTAAAVPVRIIESRDAAHGEPEAGSLAPFNTRLIAALIDVAVAFGLNMTALVLPSFLGRLVWLVALAYLVTRDSLPFLGGQSVGKKAMKIKAVTVDGKSLVNNWEPALIRNGVLLIPLFPLIELFILLTREGKPEHGRRLGDEWAKTQVILAPEPPAAG